MRFNYVLLLVSVLLISACGTSKKSTSSITKIESNALNGVFFGTIPCADCEGIEYIIAFNEDFTYNTKSVYLGKSEKPLETSGNYTIEDEIIKLLNDDEGMRYFIETGKNLQILDRNREEIAGSLAHKYILNPLANQSETAEGNVHKLKIKRASEGIDFFAIGNEPSWSLTMDFDKKFQFHSLSGVALSTPPIDSKDMLNTEKANYTLNTEAGTLEIEIYKAPCHDDMSGQLFDFKVNVQAKNGIDADFTRFSGCGTYTFDLKLHDIWVLEAISEETYSDGDFTNGLPRLEIFTEEQRFGGKDGCNILTGNIETSANTILFKDARSTRMACRDNTKSDLYREVIMEKSYRFQVKNNMLILSDSTGERLRFKKID